MIRLVLLLAAVMFVALLIGGEDNGQVRQGLMDPPPAAPSAPRGVAVPETKPVNFIPVTITPQSDPQIPQAPAQTTGAFVVDGTPVKEMAVQIASDPVMYVNSQTVNVRAGPSTDYTVVGRVTMAEAVSVVSPPVDGWVQIRIEGDGINGYVAARLLTDVEPLN
jgi:hypothetical protein